VEHKFIVLPEVDLSHDEGDPRYLAEGETTPLYREGEDKPYAYRWNGLAPGHYAEYWRLCVVESWEQQVARYEADHFDVYNAYWYIDGHPVFWKFTRNVYKDYPKNHVSNLIHEGAMRSGWPEITPHKVNPETRRIEEDEEKNTVIEWWYEFGPTDLFGGMTSHDYELDGGTASYDAAVIEIAFKIHEYYGNDRALVDYGDEYWKNRKLLDEPGGKGKFLKALIESRNL